MTVSQATMRQRCAEKARVPRVATDGSGRFGRFLTVGEIKDLHFKAGYSKRSTKTIPGNIQAWAYIGEVGYAEGADLNDSRTIIWWRSSDETELKLKAEKARVDPQKIVMEPPIVIFGEEER